MYYLKCTKKVRDFAGIMTESKDTAVDDPTDLGSWYIHMCMVDRKKTLIFMNERTLMSFIAYGVKKSNCSDIPLMFLHGLEQLLQMEEVPDDRIVQILSTYAGIGYANTDSRSALGNLNDLVATYKHYILDDGGFLYCDLHGAIHIINRIPQRNLGWKSSAEAMQEILTLREVDLWRKPKLQNR